MEIRKYLDQKISTYLAISLLIVIFFAVVSQISSVGRSQRESVEAAGRMYDAALNRTDGHGCSIEAGYSWCEGKKKCLRTWEEQCPKKANFKKIGNYVAKPIEGIANEKPVFVYEEPGSPALEVVLVFDDDSQCDFGQGEAPCLDHLTSGERVSVEGYYEEKMRTLTVINLNSAE